MRMRRPLSSPLYQSPELKQADLMSRPPHQVAELLERTGRESAKSRFNWDSAFAPGLLSALHSRGERLIDLAIAQYGDNGRVLLQMWQSKDQALRHAIASNQVAGPRIDITGRSDTSAIANALADEVVESEDLVRDLLTEGDETLVSLFFSNPKVGTGWLRAIFDRNSPFDSLDDTRWLGLCRYATGNPLLHEPRPDESFSTYPEDMERSNLFEALTRLLLRVDVSRTSASILASHLHLIDRLELPCDFLKAETDHPIGSPEWKHERERLAVAEAKLLVDRWTTEKAGDAAVETQEEPHVFGYMREVLVPLLPQYHSGVRDFLQGHPDLHVRRGCYVAKTYSSADDVRADFERDGKEFLDAALDNDSLYRIAYANAADEFDRLVAGSVFDGDHRDFENGQLRRARRFNMAKRLFEFDPVQYLQPSHDRQHTDPFQGNEDDEAPQRARMRKTFERLEMLCFSVASQPSGRAVGAAMMRSAELAMQRFEQLHMDIRTLRQQFPFNLLPNFGPQQVSPTERQWPAAALIIVGIVIGYMVNELI